MSFDRSLLAEMAKHPLFPYQNCSVEDLWDIWPDTLVRGLKPLSKAEHKRLSCASPGVIPSRTGSPLASTTT